jgi:ketosteroid isomerase-like protein
LLKWYIENLQNGSFDQATQGVLCGISEGAKAIMVTTKIAVGVISLLFVSELRLGLAQNETTTETTTNRIQVSEVNKECVSVTNHNAELMLEIFRAIEQRDEQKLRELFDPGLEMHWPSSLPYGGTHTASTPGPATWAQTWFPLQPTDAERRMDPRVVAAAGDEVVVLWQQRGVAPAGERFDGEVLALYKLRGGKLIRAQMFYFDTVATARFLANARVEVQKK